MPKKRDPRFTFDFYADSDRVLMVDGKRVNLRVRQWSPGWWGVMQEENSLGALHWVYSDVQNGTAIFGRVRRWRSIERAEDFAIELWIERENENRMKGS